MKLIALTLAAIAFSGSSKARDKAENTPAKPAKPTEPLTPPQLADAVQLSEEEKELLAEKTKVDEKKEKLLPLKEKVETAKKELEEAESKLKAASARRQGVQTAIAMSDGMRKDDEAKLQQNLNEKTELENKAEDAAETSSKNFAEAKNAYNSAWIEMANAEKERRLKGHSADNKMQTKVALGSWKVTTTEAKLAESEAALAKAKKILQNLEKTPFGAKAEEDAKKDIESNTAKVSKCKKDHEVAKTEVAEASKTKKAVEKMLVDFRKEYTAFVDQNQRY